MSRKKKSDASSTGVKMRFEKPFEFDSLLKKEQLSTNDELREKNLPPIDQTNLIIELCQEAIKARNKKREDSAKKKSK